MPNAPGLPLTFRASRLTWVGMLAVCGLFVAGGILMISREKPEGWLPTLFFGLCLPIALVNLHPRASYLRITSEGLEMSSLFRTSMVRWDSIAGFGVYEIKTHGLTASRMVGFNFVPKHGEAARMRKVSKLLAGFEGGLPDTYGWKAEELAELLNFYLAEHGSNLGGGEGRQEN